jgi:hypothetical protein
MTQQSVTYIVGPSAPTISDKMNEKIKNGWLVKHMVGVQSVVIVLYEKNKS